MHHDIICFGIENISKKDIYNKKVLEIGSITSKNPTFSGNLNSIITKYNPKEFYKTDTKKNKNVNYICSITKLIEIFGENYFDYIICSEVIEHVNNWKKAIYNIKKVCKIKGKIFITTRSIGFPYHSFPKDFWRFSKEDLNNIFKEFKINNIQKDKSYPGIFLIAQKEQKRIISLKNMKIYSIIKGNKIKKHKRKDLISIRYFCLITSEKIIKVIDLLSKIIKHPFYLK